MNAEEKEIYDYLKTWPNLYISGREIARRVGGKSRYEEDRFWGVPILATMVNKGWLEADFTGAFRIKREDRKKNKFKRHVSPQMIRILKSSGKSFDTIVLDDDDDGPSISARPKVKPLNSSSPDKEKE